MKLVIPIDNGPIDHVNIDVDLRFSFSIIRPNHDHPKELAIVYLQGFDVQTDIDLPWYLDVLWFGIFESFVEGKIDESVEKQLKPKLLKLKPLKLKPKSKFSHKSYFYPKCCLQPWD